MHDASIPTGAAEAPATARPMEPLDGKDTVSTHVLVEEEKVAKLRELSRRTRIAQSEYLREAVDDLLGKYQRGEVEK